MNWKQILLGLGIGASTGIGIRQLVKLQSKLNYIKPEKALFLVKKRLSKKGKIMGSWIYTIPETYEQSNIDFKSYWGGITVKEEDDLKYYTFFINALDEEIIKIV